MTNRATQATLYAILIVLIALLYGVISGQDISTLARTGADVIAQGAVIFAVFLVIVGVFLQNFMSNDGR